MTKSIAMRVPGGWMGVGITYVPNYCNNFYAIPGVGLVIAQSFSALSDPPLGAEALDLMKSVSPTRVLEILKQRHAGTLTWDGGQLILMNGNETVVHTGTRCVCEADDIGLFNVAVASNVMERPCVPDKILLAFSRNNHRDFRAQALSALWGHARNTLDVRGTDHSGAAIFVSDAPNGPIATARVNYTSSSVDLKRQLSSARLLPVDDPNHPPRSDLYDEIWRGEQLIERGCYREAEQILSDVDGPYEGAAHYVRILALRGMGLEESRIASAVDELKRKYPMWAEYGRRRGTLSDPLAWVPSFSAPSFGTPSKELRSELVLGDELCEPLQALRHWHPEVTVLHPAKVRDLQHVIAKLHYSTRIDDQLKRRQCGEIVKQQCAVRAQAVVESPSLRNILHIPSNVTYEKLRKHALHYALGQRHLEAELAGRSGTNEIARFLEPTLVLQRVRRMANSISESELYLT